MVVFRDSAIDIDSKGDNPPRKVFLSRDHPRFRDVWTHQVDGMDELD